MLLLLTLSLHPASAEEGSDGQPRVLELLGTPAAGGPFETEVSFSPDGKYLAWGGPDGTIHVHDVYQRVEARAMRAHEGPVLAVRYSPDGAWIASGGANGARIWDAADGHLVAAIGQGGGPVTGVEISPDRRVLETFNQALALWDVASGKPLPSRGMDSGDGTIRFSPARGASGFTPGWGTHYWDLATGKGFWGLGDRRDATGFSCFTQDGVVLAKAGGGSFGLWESATGGWIGTWDGFGTDAVDLAFAPGGRTLGAIDRMGAVHCVDLSTTDSLWRSEPERVSYLTFSRDGQRLAAGRSDGTVILWHPGRLAAGRIRWKPRTQAELEEAWRRLCGADAERAWRGVWALVEAGDAGVDFLRTKLVSSRIDEDAVRRLIADLDADDFAVRDAAQSRLLRVRAEARPLLQAALEGHPSPELRSRIELLMGPLNPDLPLSPGEELTGLRAVAALERIGSASASALLAELAGGPSGARLTLDARAACARLEVMASTIEGAPRPR